MKSLIAAATLAASFVLVEGWDAPAHAQTPHCYSIEMRDSFLKGGWVVVETHTQPGKTDPDTIITWESWIHPEVNVYGITGRDEDTICEFETGPGINPPKILDRVEDTRPVERGEAL